MTTPSPDDFDLCDLEELKLKGSLVFQFRAPGIGPHEIALFWNGEDAYSLGTSAHTSLPLSRQAGLKGAR